MPKYGIIDLGSNTIRLSIFDVPKPEKRGEAPKFREIVDEKQVVGLSSYIEDGNLTAAGIEKATDTLARHLRTARNIGCKSCHIFATAVIRNCKNSGRVVKQIERTINSSVDVLSGEEEARLGLVGASHSCDIREGVLIDIGGGSSEVTQVHKKRGITSLSLPQGSVSSYAEYVRMVFPTREECAQITDALAARIEEQPYFPEITSEKMFGIGGTVRAMAKMYARMNGRDKTPAKLLIANIDSILKLVVEDPPTFVHMAVKAVPDRLHTLVPGTLIARQLMLRFRSEELVICKYGVREGYLLTHVV